MPDCIRYHPFKTSAFFSGGGVKNLPNLPNLPMDSSKKMPTEGVGVKNRENLPTSLNGWSLKLFIHTYFIHVYFFLGAKVVVVEKRDRYSRNNVLHLWPYNIVDLRGLGAKKFYGKFCAGSIDHISIRALQCILLKVALLLGVEVFENCGFEGV